MELVVDANVLFSALLCEGATAELMFADQLLLYSPEFILKELERHERELLRKFGNDEADFHLVLQILHRRLLLVPFENFVGCLDIADKISPDEADVSYLALALHLKIPLWSNDKDLKEKQTLVQVYSTHELKKLLNF